MGEAGTRIPGQGCSGEHFSGCGPVIAWFPHTSPTDIPEFITDGSVEYHDPHNGHLNPFDIVFLLFVEQCLYGFQVEIIGIVTNGGLYFLSKAGLLKTELNAIGQQL